MGCGSSAPTVVPTTSAPTTQPTPSPSTSTPSVSPTKTSTLTPSQQPSSSTPTVWVIVSTSEESTSRENVMSFIKSLVNNTPNVKMGFDWKSSGNEYEEDKRKWKMINSLVEDFFKTNGEVDE